MYTHVYTLYHVRLPLAIDVGLDDDQVARGVLHDVAREGVGLPLVALRVAHVDRVGLLLVVCCMFMLFVYLLFCLVVIISLLLVCIVLCVCLLLIGLLV